MSNYFKILTVYKKENIITEREREKINKFKYEMKIIMNKLKYFFIKDFNFFFFLKIK